MLTGDSADPGPFPGRPPCFFFSYARKDRDRYLDKFFKDLSDRIESKGGRDPRLKEVSFRDLEQIEPGEDWEREIAAYLQHSLSLVCIYTPWYFKRPYCGKELQVFLNRQPGRTLQDGAIRNVTKILPILWEKERDLKRQGLPPRLLRYIQYMGGAHHERYKNEGLRGILRRTGDRGAYVDLVEYFADRLLDEATDPLPPLPQTPDLKQLPSAFTEPGGDGAPADPVPAADGAPDAQTLVVVYPTTGTSGDDLEQWRPFDTPKTAAAWLGETADEFQWGTTLVPINVAQPAAGQGVLEAVQQANLKDAPVLLLINLKNMTDPGYRAALDPVLHSQNWKGGILVLGAQADPAVGPGIPLAEVALAPLAAQPGRVVIWRIYAQAALQTLASMFNLMLQHNVQTGQVRRAIPQSSFDRKPLIQAPG